MSTLIAGLLFPKDERKRPQRDKNSPEIPSDFPYLTAAFPRIPRLPDIRCLSSSSNSSLLEENIFCHKKTLFTRRTQCLQVTCDL